MGDANQSCHPLLSPFTSCLQPFPASGSFPMSQLIASGGQSIGASAAAWVLPMNIQGWFPLGLTGLISLSSKGLSRVFSSTTSQKHWFFYAQPRINMNAHEPINLRTSSVPLNFPLYPYRPASLPWDTNVFFFLSFIWLHCLTRDWTCTLRSESTKSYPMDCQGIPDPYF